MHLKLKSFLENSTNIHMFKMIQSFSNCSSTICDKVMQKDQDLQPIINNLGHFSMIAFIIPVKNNISKSDGDF